MIICIVGPTAVGKTKLSIELAKKYKAIIINCDSTQVYKGLNIGTAKITEEEKEGIPHYLIDIVSINDNYTVYDYQKAARKIIEENKDKNIILVGGTGLYLKATLYNYVFQEENKIRNNYDNLTNEELYQLALKKEPNLEIHKNNRQRLIRFLNKETVEKEECYPLYQAIYIGLTTDRETLYERINKRTEEMFKKGLLEEVESLLPYFKTSKILNSAIDYKELYAYFNKELTLEETKELINKNCRHYAKRQYTWFNNQFDVKWFNTNFTDFNQTIIEVEEYLDKVLKNS